MRLVLTLLLVASAAGWGPPRIPTPGSAPAAPTPAAEEKPAPVRFEEDVTPILSRCRPCHYPGGKMHGRMPFDDEATVRKTGEKLFTRVKDEKDREVLRRFFAAAH